MTEKLKKIVKEIYRFLMDSYGTQFDKGFYSFINHRLLNDVTYYRFNSSLGPLNGVSEESSSDPFSSR